MITKQEFGNRMIKLREEKKISQAQAAREMNIPKSTLNDYEKGRLFPSYESLIKLADYYCVTGDYLFGRTDVHKLEHINICKHLGLSESAIEMLQRFTEWGVNASSIIEHPCFLNVLTSVREAVFGLMDKKYYMEYFDTPYEEREALFGEKEGKFIDNRVAQLVVKKTFGIKSTSITPPLLYGLYLQEAIWSLEQLIDDLADNALNYHKSHKMAKSDHNKV